MREKGKKVELFANYTGWEKQNWCEKGKEENIKINKCCSSNERELLWLREVTMNGVRRRALTKWISQWACVCENFSRILFALWLFYFFTLLHSTRQQNRTIAVAGAAAAAMAVC